MKKANEYTRKELKEMEVTDKFGKVVPMSIEQKRGFLGIFDHTFKDFNFKDSDDEEKTN